MSLDVYLESDEEERECRCNNCGLPHMTKSSVVLYNANITHNLGRMADAAGIYEALWRPEEIGVSRAVELIGLLRDGLASLKASPGHYEQYNAENGWGLYKHFVPFVEEYLLACEEHPTATVRVSR